MSVHDFVKVKENKENSIILTPQENVCILVDQDHAFAEVVPLNHFFLVHGLDAEAEGLPG
jgi:hypothetical protein